MNTNTPSQLSSDVLTSRLSALVGEERARLVDFLHHLVEFDRRKLYAELSYSSLWAYLTEELRLSNGSAYRRCIAARLLPRFPIIADLLGDGRISLKRLSVVADLLTAENHVDLLSRAGQGSEKQLEMLVATLKPKPDVKDSIRRVPERTARAAPALPLSSESVLTTPATSTVEVTPRVSDTAADSTPSMTMAEPVAEAHARTSTVEVNPGIQVRAERKVRLVPTSATAYALTARVSPQFKAELDEVKAALSHKFPDGDFEDVLRECFRITMETIERRRCGSPRSAAAKTTKSRAPCASSATPAPALSATEDSTVPKESSVAGDSTRDTSSAPMEPSTTGIPSRYVPTQVRNAVWKRDGGCCAYVGRNGKRCGSTYQLQLHHIEEFARGGSATVENLSLRCSVHNRYEAELSFGADFVRSKIHDRTS